MSSFKVLVLALVAGALSGVLCVYLGIFNVAADVPHSKPLAWLMEAARERSVAVRARDIEVPPLDDPALLAEGAIEYREMCVGCHLQPGVTESEMWLGMYPQPPRLSTEAGHDPAETFWIIKHGLKMTGMPAWGLTHDDARLWAIVAFLQQLPRLSPAEYQALVAPRDGAVGGHDHGPHSEGSTPHAH